MTRRKLLIALAVLLILLVVFFLMRYAFRSPAPAATEVPIMATETIEPTIEPTATTEPTIEPTETTEPTMEPETTESAEIIPTKTPVYENPFATMEINDMNGEPFDVSVFSGKPFMINVWASWCGPCVTEMPDLDALSKEYGDRITMLGLMGDAVVVDTQGELMLNQSEINDSRALYERLGISYPSLIPNALMMSLMYQIQMQYFPTTLFFDGGGYLVGMEVGSKSKEDWAKAIDAVLIKIQEEKAK